MEWIALALFIAGIFVIHKGYKGFRNKEVTSKYGTTTFHGAGAQVLSAGYILLGLMALAGGFRMLGLF